MVHLKILAEDCKTAQYTNIWDCPLARAINRRIDRTKWIARVGGFGEFTIRKEDDKSCVFSGTILNFSVEVVRTATKDFIRKVDIPAEFLKKRVRIKS
jgi:hypothetical protein